MAISKKAKQRRPARATTHKETVPDAPSSTSVNSSAAALRVVPPTEPADPEVAERAARRRFSAEYKLQVLRQAEACTSPGDLGALLRREGLYSSHLTTWRRQREQGSLAALSPKKRGRPALPPSPLARRVAELERDNARLTQRLQQAETIIAVQKKLSEALGIPLTPGDSAKSS
jgi:transposase-like protein